jgi:uncharacterized protein YmfQ (DUF2313 family)
MPTVWGSGGGGAVLVVDGLGGGMVESGGFDLEALQLLPHGQAWSRRPSSTTRKLAVALSRTFARLDADVQRLRDEMDPRTADESLAAWESFAGLPHSCSSDPPTTLQGRRSALVAKLFRSRGLLDRPRARAIAAELGYTITFPRTYRPFRCGSKCGAPLAGSVAGWFAHALILATPSNPELNGTLTCLLKQSAQAPMLVTVIPE